MQFFVSVYSTEWRKVIGLRGGEGGWCEPAVTNAPVEDEAIQAVLGMNQKPILFPYPRISQPPSLPQNFLLLPTSPPSYLPHLISHSLHLKSLVELLSLKHIELRDTRLEEGGEFNVEGTWRGEGKKSTLSQMQKQENKGRFTRKKTCIFN